MRIVSVVACLIGVVLLCLFVSFDRRQIQQAKLQDNVRRAQLNRSVRDVAGFQGESLGSLNANEVSKPSSRQEMPEIWIDVRRVTFDDVDPAGKQSQSFHVFANVGDAQLKNLRADRPQLDLTVTPASAEQLSIARAAQGWKISATCLPGEEKREAGHIEVEIATGDRTHQDSLPFEIIRAGRIQMFHRKLDVLGDLEIGNLPYGAGTEIVIVCKVRGKNRRVTLDRIEATPAFLEATWEPLPGGAETGSYKLVLRIPPEAPEGSYSGDQEGSVILHFSDSDIGSRTLRPAFYITRN